MVSHSYRNFLWLRPDSAESHSDHDNDEDNLEILNQIWLFLVIFYLLYSIFVSFKPYCAHLSDLDLV